ncbi:NUDIX domain-containing protein [Planktotalea sp.]|uniref:NUDIX domain-containing protein n=1 Tax=Planktotalea sp. TaxID=2029877 RepID=UPI003D6BD95C
MYKGLRLGVRAIIVQENRLLLVNAYPEGSGPELWCAPGGGVEMHSSLPENLKREVHEETGLEIEVGSMALLNEFHDPDLAFHQVEIFFRANVLSGEISDKWIDPEGIVQSRRFFSADELKSLTIKPSSLTRIAFDADAPISYDPLERLMR